MDHRKPVQGAAARHAAVRLLHSVTVLGKPFDRDFDSITQRLGKSDRALAMALSMFAIRHLKGLDELIDSACARPLPADARARQALRIALAGRLGMDTPPHVAIATILPSVEGGPRRLVHGVLSTLFRRNATLPPATLPETVARRWEAAWGRDVVQAAARQLAAPPPLDIRLREPNRTAEWAEALQGFSLFEGHVRIPGQKAITELPGFASGDWWVQDAAAQLPAMLLGDVAGLRLLDLCAAPGGKTMQLAAAGADVIALDISGNRVERLHANLERTGLRAETIVADALIWEPEAPFDAVLVDAPCSATGTFRRHPEVLMLRAELDLTPLLALQDRLFARAASWLRPGGRLVAAVCSLEPEEGGWDAGILSPDPVLPAECPAGLAPSDGAVLTLPGLWEDRGGADGFQIMRWRSPA